MEARVLKHYFPLSKLMIGEGARSLPLTRKIRGRLPAFPLVEKENRDRESMGKSNLHLLLHKGAFLKPCPGTRAYICCGYQILNVAANCPMDCSYCILQAYFNQPNLRIFVNIEKGLEDALRRIDREPETTFRVGTGEFTDSLAMDPLVGWSDLLLPHFSKRKNAILELKTKTAHIESLLTSKHRDRIVVSWSLNSTWIASHEEHGAPSLKKRLEAARICQSEGYTIGIHFDPLIPHPGWREDYLRTLELMDRHIDPKGIIWLSMGSFRYMPELKKIIRKRHPGTSILEGEFVPGLDGKMRYFKPIRIDLYAHMGENLAKWHADLGLYLCMESDDVWTQSLGWSPKNDTGLRLFLDHRVESFFG